VNCKKQDPAWYHTFFKTASGTYIITHRHRQQAAAQINNNSAETKAARFIHNYHQQPNSN
jgi:hypothetical protein